MSGAADIVSKVTDPPFGWTSRYAASWDDEQINLRIRINFRADERISLKEILQLRRETDESVDRYFNQRFELVDPEGRVRTLRVIPEFVADNQDQSIRLHPGSGRSNLKHWFVEADSIVRAHEIGHALGLRDEYMDPGCFNRARADSPGVYRDHSLMGNFFREGVDQAELKTRHGELFAFLLAEKMGIPLAVREQVRLGKPLSPETLPAHDWARSIGEIEEPVIRQTVG